MFQNSALSKNSFQNAVLSLNKGTSSNVCRKAQIQWKLGLKEAITIRSHCIEAGILRLINFTIISLSSQNHEVIQLYAPQIKLYGKHNLIKAIVESKIKQDILLNVTLFNK